MYVYVYMYMYVCVYVYVYMYIYFFFWSLLFLSEMHDLLEGTSLLGEEPACFFWRAGIFTNSSKFSPNSP